MTTEIHSYGTGPGLVVVHGAGVSYPDYRRLARALSGRFTVHLYNRRGRPGAPPFDVDTYTLADEIDDLRYVMTKTASTNVFGHSYGTFVALHAAFELPIERLAIFDPVVIVPGGVPTDFVEPFSRAIAAGDYPLAMAVMNRSMKNGGPGSSLPVGVQVQLGKLFLRTPIGKAMARVLPTVPAELRQILAHELPVDAYAAIEADTLVAAGGRGPDYFKVTARTLADAIPKASYLLSPGVIHNAPNIARPRFVTPFADFFAGIAEPAQSLR